MKAVASVTSAQIGHFTDGFREFVVVSASGEVSTTGWTEIRLSPRFYVVDPPDGIWDFDLVGDPPTGIVGQIVLSVSAQSVFYAPTWPGGLKGVRIHSASNNVVGTDNHLGITCGLPQTSLVSMVTSGHVILTKNLTSYDDSIQPTGTIHWKGLTPHAEMKKLRHDLVLTVEGPDINTINDCLNKSIAAGLLAGILAAIATDGVALPAAISAFLSTMEGCLGNAYSAKIEDHSHWIRWDS